MGGLFNLFSQVVRCSGGQGQSDLSSKWRGRLPNWEVVFFSQSVSPFPVPVLTFWHSSISTFWHFDIFLSSFWHISDIFLASLCHLSVTYCHLSVISLVSFCHLFGIFLSSSCRLSFIFLSSFCYLFVIFLSFLYHLCIILLSSFCLLFILSFCLSVFLTELALLSSLEVSSDQSEACFDDLEALWWTDGMDGHHRS